jgi:hypothetical protein
MGGLHHCPAQRARSRLGKRPGPRAITGLADRGRQAGVAEELVRRALLISRKTLLFYKRLLVAANYLVESQVPLVRQARTIREGGESPLDTSTLIVPQTRERQKKEDEDQNFWKIGGGGDYTLDDLIQGAEPEAEREAQVPLLEGIRRAFDPFIPRRSSGQKKDNIYNIGGSNRYTVDDLANGYDPDRNFWRIGPPPKKKRTEEDNFWRIR